MSADRDALVPLPYRVAARHVETRDSVTLQLEPLATPIAPFTPGQFTMLCAPGVGEIAVSISGDPAAPAGSLAQTVRDVGAISRAVNRATEGDRVGVRGPFGVGWGLETADGHDLVLVAGGLGLAPLRPVILAVLAHPERYGDVRLIAGAREPDEFLFHDQLGRWASGSAVEVLLTVDQPATGWHGSVGFVTEPLAHLTIRPERTVAMLCGPEPMMRMSANILLGKGVRPADIRLSLERNMQCGAGLCGHCQLGPLLVCRDGPVVDYAVAGPLLAVREL